MPRFRLERSEQGTRYSTHEVIANTKEEAEDLIFDDLEGPEVGGHFKQYDCENGDIEEIPMLNLEVTDEEVDFIIPEVHVSSGTPLFPKTRRLIDATV